MPEKIQALPPQGAKLYEMHGHAVSTRARHSRAAQKNLAEHVADQAAFHDEQLKPRLDQALAGVGHVFFVDAAHFVFGTYLCCLWSFTRIFVRAASGRQRFNVLGAWNATLPSPSFAPPSKPPSIGYQRITPRTLPAS